MNESDDDEQPTRGAITPDELRQILADLGLTGAALARLVAVDKGAPGRWLSGAVPVPLWLAEHLSLLLALRRICRAIWASEPSDPAPLPARLAHLGNILTGDENKENKPTKGIGASISVMQKASAENHTMSPEDFRSALAGLGWKQSDFVRRVGCAKNTASRWAQGVTEIPAWVPAHLSLLAEVEGLHARFVRPEGKTAPGTP